SRHDHEFPGQPADRFAAAGEFTAAELAARLRAPGELTAAEAAALDRLDGGWPDPDDDSGYCDPDSCAPDVPGDDAERPELAERGEPAVAEALQAGFTHRYGSTGTGFAAGGPLDVMLPGPGLAWHIGLARQAGLGGLSDDELIGVLGAAR